MHVLARMPRKQYSHDDKPHLDPHALVATPYLYGLGVRQPRHRNRRARRALDSGHRFPRACRCLLFTLVTRDGQVADDAPAIRQADHQLADFWGNFTFYEVGHHRQHGGKFLSHISGNTVARHPGYCGDRHACRARLRLATTGAAEHAHSGLDMMVAAQ